MDTTVITDLVDYFEKDLDYTLPSRTPFAGKNFNVTRAGIHADGLLKNEEIYNIFDTEKILKETGTGIYFQYFRSGWNRTLDQQLLQTAAGTSSGQKTQNWCIN